jgi:hypothetical protein
MGLARGYRGHADLTAEKFVPNAFANEPGARLYRTGDLARYLSDGNIEFLGRIDHQVKIRGFRIELGEIETVLTQHPAVGGAVTVARETSPGEKQLVTYVARRSGVELVVSEVRKFLRTKLPDYMVPSMFVTLDELPLTPNGKIDRRALPDPDSLNREMNGGYVAPRTPMESLIAGIWREVLRTERIGAHDNFFDLGGHSLLSMRVISRVEKQTGQRIHPREILFQTLEQLAAMCEQRIAGAVPEVSQAV